MERSQDKDAKLETVKPQGTQERKHEGARENRPQRPGMGEAESKDLETKDFQKKDETKDDEKNEAPLAKRDEEQDKKIEDVDENNEDAPNLDAGDDEKEAEGSDGVTNVEPSDKNTPSQGV